MLPAHLASSAVLITRDDSDGRTHMGKIKKLHQRLIESGLYTHTLSEPEDWDSLDAKVMVSFVSVSACGDGGAEGEV